MRPLLNDLDDVTFDGNGRTDRASLHIATRWGDRSLHVGVQTNGLDVVTFDTTDARPSVPTGRSNTSQEPTANSQQPRAKSQKPKKRIPRQVSYLSEDSPMGKAVTYSPDFTQYHRRYWA